MALYQVLDAGLNLRDLLDILRKTQYWTVLDTMDRVHAKTARRLLREARDLRGSARRTKLVLALSSLETLNTLRAKGSSGWEPLRGSWELALLMAIVYRAVGDDMTTVRRHLDTARDDYRIWAARRLADPRIAWYRMPGNSTFMSIMPRSWYVATENEIDGSGQENAEFQAAVDRFNKLADHILQVGLEPDDIDDLTNECAVEPPAPV
jgi:hypothetical protein